MNQQFIELWKKEFISRYQIALGGLRGSKILEEHYFLVSEGFSRTKDPDVYYSKMFQVAYVIGAGNLRMEVLGFLPGWGCSLTRDRFLTSRSVEPEIKNEISIKDILEPNVPRKYFLSDRKMQLIKDSLDGVKCPNHEGADPNEFSQDAIDRPRIKNRISIKWVRKNIQVVFYGFQKDAYPYVDQIYAAVQAEWKNETYCFSEITFFIEFIPSEDVDEQGNVIFQSIISRLRDSYKEVFWKKFYKKNDKHPGAVRATEGLHSLVIVSRDGRARMVGGLDH